MSQTDGTTESVDREETPEEALVRLRRQNRSRYRSRMAIVACALLIASGIHFRRSIALRSIGEWQAFRGGGDRISAADAIREIAEENAMILDVRDRVEFETSHLPGAKSLPLDALKRDGWPKDWETGRPIVVYCTVGYRSGRAAEWLASQGMEAKNVAGGILALADEGEALVDDHGRTFRLHTWSEDYAWLAPPLYEAVWTENPGR